MKSEGSTSAAVVATAGIDLPIDGVKKPAHWPKHERLKTTRSPFAQRHDAEAMKTAWSKVEQTPEQRASDERRFTAPAPVPTPAAAPAPVARPVPKPPTPRPAPVVTDAVRRAEDAMTAARASTPTHTMSKPVSKPAGRQCKANTGYGDRCAARTAGDDGLCGIHRRAEQLAAARAEQRPEHAPTSSATRDLASLTGDVERRTRLNLQRDEIIRLYVEEEMSVEDVAATIGAAPRSISYQLAKAGVQLRPPRKPVDPRREQALAMLRAGATPAEVQRTLLVSEQSVLRWRRAAGLPVGLPGSGRPRSQPAEPVAEPSAPEVVEQDPAVAALAQVLARHGVSRVLAAQLARHFSAPVGPWRLVLVTEHAAQEVPSCVVCGLSLDPAYVERTGRRHHGSCRLPESVPA